MKPILFNTEMVKAILEGRKTVTRRVLKLPFEIHPNGFITKPKGNERLCPYEPPFQTNDILYVRETWREFLRPVGAPKEYDYKADVHNALMPVFKGQWKPSIHMPKEAARLFLKVTDVRVERLQDITEAQAVKEGCQAGFYEYKGAVFGDEDTEEWTAIESFIDIWNSTIKKDQFKYYDWEANPYVWVIEFEVIDKPVE